MIASLDRMAWFLRAIELHDGRWSCRHGAYEYDEHDRLDEAVEHLRQLARELGPARLFAHHHDGVVVPLD